MKLPKTVNICGKPYKVLKDRELFGGKGDTGLQEMTIGTRHTEPARLFENFVHETMECVACERDFRYGKGISENSIFVMTHKEFDVFAADVATALRPMVE